jgi:hypothetical protein
MHAIIGTDQIGDAVFLVHPSILRTWARIPALGGRVGVRVKLAYHH